MNLGSLDRLKVGVVMVDMALEEALQLYQGEGCSNDWRWLKMMLEPVEGGSCSGCEAGGGRLLQCLRGW